MLNAIVGGGVGVETRACQSSYLVWTLSFLRVGKGVGRGHGCHNFLGFPGEDDLEALKAKNIKQTELVADRSLISSYLGFTEFLGCVD